MFLKCRFSLKKHKMHYNDFYNRLIYNSKNTFK